MKATRVNIFQTINQIFNMLQILELSGLNVVVNEKMFSIEVFLYFLSLFVLLKGPSEIFVLLKNPGIDVLINLILGFPNSLTSQHPSCWTKWDVSIKMAWETRCRHHDVSVGLPFSFLFIKIFRTGIWSLLYSIANCIEGLIELKRVITLQG